jgi:hypothetical protein
VPASTTVTAVEDTAMGHAVLPNLDLAAEEGGRWRWSWLSRIRRR